MSKTNFIGLDPFEVGIYDAIACFNIGNKAVLQIYDQLGLEPGHFTVMDCSAANRQRLNVAGVNSSQKAKMRRKIIRGAKKTKGDKRNRRKE